MADTKKNSNEADASASLDPSQGGAAGTIGTGNLTFEGDANAGVVDHTIGTTDLSYGETVKINPQELVTVTIKYPKDYKGRKLLPEGPCEVSAETAAIFKEQGIAK